MKLLVYSLFSLLISVGVGFSYPNYTQSQNLTRMFIVLMLIIISILFSYRSLKNARLNLVKNNRATSINHIVATSVLSISIMYFLLSILSIVIILISGGDLRQF